MFLREHNIYPITRDLGAREKLRWKTNTGLFVRPRSTHRCGARRSEKNEIDCDRSYDRLSII
jgi:hypothetical protein